MSEKTPRRIRQEQDVLSHAGKLLPYEIVQITGHARGPVIDILSENGYSTINRRAKRSEVITEEQKIRIKELYLGTPESGPRGVNGTAGIMRLKRKTVADYLRSEGLLKPARRKPKN